MVELFIRLNRIVIDRSVSQQADNESSAVNKINRIYRLLGLSAQYLQPVRFT